MTIISYQNTTDGDICFPVKGEQYLPVLDHLRLKGLHPGGKHCGTGAHEIRIGDITLFQLIQALADFRDYP
jgi:hypothetical protein